MRQILQINILIILTTLISVPSLSQKMARSTLEKGTGIDAENYPSFTFDGAWCWFSDPRAVYYEGNRQRTYSGWIDSYGDVHIAAYDHQTGQIESKVIADNLQVDDHDNPSILFDEEGHLLVFFNYHGGPRPLMMRKSSNPEDISTWNDVQMLDLNDMRTYSDFNNTYTYTNPVKLSGENGRIYLFWRGVDNKPNYATSDDNGDTWSKGKIFILPERIYNMRRPYVKVFSNGIDKIHLAFTDGHPHREPTNSIYYMYYQNGAFHKANGEKIKDLADVPVDPAQADKVYDASGNQQKGWIWDIAEDEEGNPVLAYAKFPDNENHIYSYARWDGKLWRNYDLVNAGKWFPETQPGKEEREPNYSGGLSIDHEDVNTLYLSVNRDSIFEIERWHTPNQGKKWTVERITNGSTKNNVRPFAVRNAGEGNPLQVLWMTNTYYEHYTIYDASIQIGIQPTPVSAALNQQAIKEVMHKVADWQLANPRNHHKLDWHYGAFYTGLMALYETTEERRYLNEMINLGQKHNWKLINDIYHADRLTIAQVFADLYMKEKDPDMLEKIQWVMDMHVDRKSKADVTFKNNPYKLEWWTWCDALYMAPPAFARVYKATGDDRYLNYLDEHWWKTSDYLYSNQDSLFYRDDRFFDARSKNDKKVFWGRGNGWVIAGLARTIPYLPADYKNRDKFETQFKEMAHKLLRIQQDDGLWRASLDDPEELPIGESSGSAFFTYALTWGINNGLLEPGKFEPAVKKAWQALVGNVSEAGRLGYVQQVAGSPYPFYEDEFQVYASGAFLLAGHEMLKLIENK